MHLSSVLISIDGANLNRANILSFHLRLYSVDPFLTHPLHFHSCFVPAFYLFPYEFFLVSNARNSTFEFSQWKEDYLFFFVRASRPSHTYTLIGRSSRSYAHKL